MFNNLRCIRRVISYTVPSSYYSGLNGVQSQKLMLNYSWGSIQLLVDLSIEAKTILGLLPLDSLSTFSISWINIPMKFSKSILPDEIILGIISDIRYPEILLTSDRLAAGFFISGKHGLEVEEFVDEESKVSNAFTDVKLVDQNYPFKQKSYSYQGGVVKTESETDITDSLKSDLSPQSILFLLMYISHTKLWVGREEMFKILQYTDDQVRQDALDLFRLQESRLQLLSKILKVDLDNKIYKSILNMISVPLIDLKLSSEKIENKN